MIEGIDIDEPDWTPFDKYPQNELTCYCDAIWHSHAKAVQIKPRADGSSRGFSIIARIACPQCGKRTRVRRSSSPPERMTLRA